MQGVEAYSKIGIKWLKSTITDITKGCQSCGVTVKSISYK